MQRWGRHKATWYTHAQNSSLSLPFHLFSLCSAFALHCPWHFLRTSCPGLHISSLSLIFFPSLFKLFYSLSFIFSHCLTPPAPKNLTLSYLLNIRLRYTVKMKNASLKFSCLESLKMMWNDVIFDSYVSAKEWAHLYLRLLNRNCCKCFCLCVYVS